MSDHEEKNINGLSTDEFLERVEKAAREGARQGSKGAGRGFNLVGFLFMLALLAGIVYIGYRIHNFTDSTRDLFTRDTSVEEHDLVIEDSGILGYTAVDFQEAILGDSSQQKKLQVFEIELSDTAELKDTGFANWKALSKTQLITYHGIATYTVDLSQLSEDDITLDEENMIVRIKIPHAVRETINIPEDKIEFGDVSKGLLAIGDMKMKPEDTAKIQKEAREKMGKRLDEQKIDEEADRFAKMSVWEIYQPIINKVTTGYSLEVVMESDSK